MKRKYYFALAIFILVALSTNTICCSSGGGGGDDTPKVELISEELKWTDQSGSYHYYAWQAVIKNNTDDTLKGYVEMKLYDKDNFVLEDDREYVTLNPKATTTVYGSGMMKASLATQITHYSVTKPQVEGSFKLSN